MNLTVFIKCKLAGNCRNRLFKILDVCNENQIYIDANNGQDFFAKRVTAGRIHTSLSTSWQMWVFGKLLLMRQCFIAMNCISYTLEMIILIILKKNTHFRAPSIFILHFFSHDFPITSTEYFAPKYIFCRCTFANSGKSVKINFLLATTRFTTSRNLRIAKQLLLHVNFTMATVGGWGGGGWE